MCPGFMVKVDVLLSHVYNLGVFISSSITLPPLTLDLYLFDTQQCEHTLSTREAILE